MNVCVYSLRYEYVAPESCRTKGTANEQVRVNMSSQFEDKNVIASTIGLMTALLIEIVGLGTEPHSKKNP